MPLGAEIVDLEGMTTDGIYFYGVGSQSKSHGFDRAGLVRFRFNTHARRVQPDYGLNSERGEAGFPAGRVGGPLGPGGDP